MRAHHLGLRVEREHVGHDLRRACRFRQHAGDVHIAEELDLRFRNKVISASQDAEEVTLQVETPEGIYTITTDWLVVADGARSNIRRARSASWRRGAGST